MNFPTGCQWVCRRELKCVEPVPTSEDGCQNSEHVLPGAFCSTQSGLPLFIQWFSVTMCYYGLSFASTSLSSGGPYLNYMLRWQSSENPTISKRKPDMEANNWSCFQQQCDDRDPWLPLLHLCHGLLGKETDPQLLSGCYQHSNKEVAIFSLAVFLLQIISGVACIFCGLLQGQTDPDLKNLQVSFC